MAKESYDHREIERAVQAKWESLGLYSTDLSDTEKDPYYLLVEFPYPSGDLHTGHWYAYAMPDIYARYLRMQGKNVLFPFGFDAFGLPAENAAIKRGLNPREWTYANMDAMRTQVRTMGVSFDWSKEVVTCDPAYYKWTQWLFSKLYEHRLAQRREAAVKWCPHDQTVLANEQVINGRCERCGHLVEERVLTQWFLKITQYAKRLLEDLESLPWRPEIKEAQRAWIGESEGAKIVFNIRSIANDDAGIVEVFTTRPDTMYGATYVVLAPEHPLVDTLLLLATNKEAIEAYRTATARKTERERSENKEKTGVRLEGLMATNPATHQEVPIFIADYVLASYGTGAVMAVPAHDERDFEFARAHDLPVRHVVIPRCVDERNPHQPGKEIVARAIIIGIVRDPKTGNYLTLDWKKQPWTTFVTGGIDEGEDVVAAAVREIQEETGYKNLNLVRVLGGPTQAEFFAAHKDVNRVTHTTSLLFELENDERDEIPEAEQQIHEIVWRTPAEVVSKNLNHAEFELIWRRVEGGQDLYTGPGILTNSAEFTGRESEEVKWQIVESVGGERVTQYRLRDWLVSRQRYWGCPIPIVYDPQGDAHLVPAEHLPWLLPTDVDFTPTGKSPLASSRELHERVENLFGKGWTPEYDTLDTFVDSSWYFVRYLDPHDEHDFSNQKFMRKWMPVDRYSGGSEHTTLHLLYARFFYKALHDLDLVPTTDEFPSEPFKERFNRGLILGPDGQKMSKSKGNVINPDELVEKYGADAVRMYLAFIGPYNEPGSYPWNLSGVEGMRRFLDRVDRLSERRTDETASPELARTLGVASAKIARDIERFKFNTAISALMVLVRDLEALPQLPRAAYGELIRLVAPFAPHLAEHLWESTVETEPTGASVHQTPWPAQLVEEDEKAKVIVQINSRKKGEIHIPWDASEEEALRAALQLPGMPELLRWGRPQRVVYVPGRILNLVIPTTSKGE